MTAAISTQTPFFNSMPPFLRVCLLSTPIKMGKKSFLTGGLCANHFFFFLNKKSTWQVLVSGNICSEITSCLATC